MTYLIILIVFLLIVSLFVLFYSPKKGPERRRHAPPVAPEVSADRPSGDQAGIAGVEVEELAASDIREVPSLTVGEGEPELELTLEEAPVAQEEELTLELGEAEAPVGAGPGAFSATEEIPFISDEEPVLVRHEEGEVAPALAGYGEDAGSVHGETPEDLAERLDFFFGSDEDTGEGQATEEVVVAPPEETAAVGEVEEEQPPAAEPAEEAFAAMTPEEYQAGLRKLEEQLRRELDGAIAARETGRLPQLESRLASVCGRLSDPAGSLAGYQQLLEEFEPLLTEISDLLPGFQEATVRRHLRGGEVEVARALLAEATPQVSGDSPLAGRIRFFSGRLAETQADYAAAGELYQQACTSDGQNPEFLYAAGRMARLLGNEEDARARLEALLATGDSALHDQARIELARVYIRAEQNDMAQTLLEQALDGLTRRLGAAHPGLGSVLHELAALHEGSGRYEEAEPLYLRALTVSEQALGPDHPLLGHTLSKLAGLYEEMEAADKAEPLYERALAIRRRVLGESHPDVGTLLNHLGNLRKQHGDYSRAESLFLSSLAIAEKALGPDHPNLAVVLNNLAELYSETGDEEKAQQYEERAFALFELPGAGGDFVEIEKDAVDLDVDANKTIAGN